MAVRLGVIRPLTRTWLSAIDLRVEDVVSSLQAVALVADEVDWALSQCLLRQDMGKLLVLIQAFQEHAILTPKGELALRVLFQANASAEEQSSAQGLESHIWGLLSGDLDWAQARRHVAANDVYAVCEWLCGFGRLPELLAEHDRALRGDQTWVMAALVCAVNAVQSLSEFEDRLTLAQALVNCAALTQQDSKLRAVVDLACASTLNKANRFEQSLPLALRAYKAQGNNVALQVLCQALNGAKRTKEATLIMRQLFDQLETVARAKGTTSAPQSAFDTDNQASAALFDLTALLESRGLEAFIISGTLLGWVRGRALLPHDKDIDVGVKELDAVPRVRDALKSSTLFDYDDDMFLRGDDLYLVQLTHVASNTHADIFFFKQRGDHLRHGIDSLFGYTQNFQFPLFDLQRVEMMGGEINIPQDYDAFLTANYGPDWRTPDVDYVVNMESPALEQRSGETYAFIGYLEATRSVTKPAKLAKIKRLLSHDANAAKRSS